MILSNEQMDQLVFDITEKILLRMPEVLGNLIKEHASMKKLTDSYLDENPNFKGHSLIIQKVLEKLEETNSGLAYEKLLVLATPKIKQQIALSSGCDTENVKKKDELDITINGQL